MSRWAVVVMAAACAGVGVEGTRADVLAGHRPTAATEAQFAYRPAQSISRLVPIGDGRGVFLKCAGTGSPTVVLVSGFRGAIDDWTHIIDPASGQPIVANSAVFERVSAFTRVCAYDRPGTTEFDGALTPSTPVPQPTSAIGNAADLRALLAAAGERGPYVIVAHSWGGLTARLFASQNPNAMAGIVLLDPGSEFLESFLTPAQWTTFADAAKALGDPATLEAADYRPSVAALRTAAPIPAIPAVVLSSDHPFDFGAGADTWPAWIAAQRAVAAALDAKHIADTDSGHFIQGEQAGLVTATIHQVVNDARMRYAGLVAIDHRRKMYLECIGAGAPTVVYIAGGFEAGWISKYAVYSTDPALQEPIDAFSAGRGSPQRLDRAVFPAAGTLSRVCNYDRPNTTLGDDVDAERGGQVSTPIAQPHAVQADVADLHALLAVAKVPGPYVLVAHSYGGLIAELYARTYPEHVAGRVYIDVTNEFLLDTFTQKELDALDQARHPAPGGEGVLVLDALHTMRAAAAAPLRPSVLLSADKPHDLGADSMATLARTRESHDLLAAQLCAKHLARTNSGHHIFAEQPQLVNDAVRDVLEAVRGKLGAFPCPVAALGAR